MLSCGDVVRFYSPTASKLKFHICIVAATTGTVYEFLFINSDDGYRGDCVFKDGMFEGLPKSRTGYSVVSFSQIVRISKDKLDLFRPKIVSQISYDVANALIKHTQSVPTLTQAEKNKILSALSQYID